MEETRMTCLFGTQFGTVLVDENNEDRELCGCYAPSRRTGFFQVSEEPDGRLYVHKFVEVTDEDYKALKKMGVFV